MFLFSTGLRKQPPRQCRSGGTKHLIKSDKIDIHWKCCWIRRLTTTGVFNKKIIGKMLNLWLIFIRIVNQLHSASHTFSLWPWEFSDWVLLVIGDFAELALVFPDFTRGLQRLYDLDYRSLYDIFIIVGLQRLCS